MGGWSIKKKKNLVILWWWSIRKIEIKHKIGYGRNFTKIITPRLIGMYFDFPNFKKNVKLLEIKLKF